MELYVANMAWSSSRWKGIPDDEDEYKNDVERSTWEYVKENKFAHEWWNFHDFSDENYFGVLPIIEDLDRYEGGTILFISKSYGKRLTGYGQGLHIIGFYCDAIRKKKQRIVKIPSFALEEVKEKLKKNKLDFALIAPKQSSFILDTHQTFNQTELFGKAKLRQNRFYKVTDEERIKIIEYLENEVFPKQTESITKEKLLNIIDILKNPTKQPGISSVLKEKTCQSDLLLKKKQVILYGPPGTGKTYITKQYAIMNLTGE